MRVSGDIVGDIIDRAVELLPDWEAALRSIEVEARHAYGADRIYVQVRRPAHVRHLIAQIDPARPVVDQAQELGLSRTTIYKYLKTRRM